MKARILGSMQVTIGDHPVAIGTARKPRLMLAALLAHAGRPLSISALTAALWDAAPPASARRNIQLYAHHLRQALGAERIVTNERGYTFASADAVDANRFRQLAERARAAADSGDPAAAARISRQALELWHGPALTEFDDCQLVADEARRLEELRLDTHERWARAFLTVGDPGRVVTELTALVRAHPFRESLCEVLMRALHQTGRQAEALEAYQRIRTHLAEHLGVEPCPALRRLHLAILRGGDDLAREQPAPVAAATMPPPAHLPAGIRDFTGRAGALATLDTLAAEAAPVLVATISGSAGMGKTALAVHWARSAAAAFPDGQLYVDLRGFDAHRTPATAEEALADLLEALDVPAAAQPAGVQQRANAFRGRTAGRRMLILLDNARDAAHVRPLLPGAGGSLVLVTSRNRLVGLAADGAVAIPLQPLPVEDARALLTARLHRMRPEPAPAAVERTVQSCEGLPLALVVAAAQATGGSRSLEALAVQLAGRRPLDGLTCDDSRTDVRAVLSWSYQALDPCGRRHFRLLSLHPGPDLSVAAAAVLCGAPVEQARRVLAQLVAYSVIDEVRPDRFAVRGLLLAYARELADLHDPPAEQHAALQRAFDHYAATAEAARMFLEDHPADRISALDAAASEPMASLVQSLSWLSAERDVLQRLGDAASRTGRHDTATRLTRALAAYHRHIEHGHPRVASSPARTRPGERPGSSLGRRAPARTWTWRSVASPSGG